MSNRFRKSTARLTGFYIFILPCSQFQWYYLSPGQNCTPKTHLHENTGFGYSAFSRHLDLNSDLYFASDLSLKTVKLNLWIKHPMTFRFTVKMEISDCCLPFIKMETKIWQNGKRKTSKKAAFSFVVLLFYIWSFQPSKI